MLIGTLINGYTSNNLISNIDTINQKLYNLKTNALQAYNTTLLQTQDDDVILLEENTTNNSPTTTASAKNIETYSNDLQSALARLTEIAIKRTLIAYRATSLAVMCAYNNDNIEEDTIYQVLGWQDLQYEIEQKNLIKEVNALEQKISNAQSTYASIKLNITKDNADSYLNEKINLEKELEEIKKERAEYQKKYECLYPTQCNNGEFNDFYANLSDAEDRVFVTEDPIYLDLIKQDSIAAQKQAVLEAQIAQIDNSLTSYSPEYAKKVEELNTQKISSSKDIINEPNVDTSIDNAENKIKTIKEERNKLEKNKDNYSNEEYIEKYIELSSLYFDYTFLKNFLNIRKKACL